MNDYYTPHFCVEICLQNQWRPIAWFAVMEDAGLFEGWLSDKYPHEDYRVYPEGPVRIIEVRVRARGDLRPWMEIPCYPCACFPDSLAHRVARHIANTVPDCQEVRWNWLDSLQGHYIQPKST